MTDQHLSVLAAMDEYMRDYSSYMTDAVDLAVHACEAFNLRTPIGSVPKWLLAAAKMIWEIYHEPQPQDA